MAFKPYCQTCNSWHNENEPHIGVNEVINDEINLAIETLRRWLRTGCPDCSGDCHSANPPVYGCIVGDTYDTIRALERDQFPNRKVENQT